MKQNLKQQDINPRGIKGQHKIVRTRGDEWEAINTLNSRGVNWLHFAIQV